MPRACIVDRGEGERRWRTVLIGEGRVEAKTGWVKRFEYAEQVKARLVEDGGAEDGGVVDVDRYAELLDDERRLTTAHGYPLDEVVSAMQKEIRRGHEIEAMFWAFEIARSGMVKYVWRRLGVIACEDVGLADPMAAVVVEGLRQSYFFAWETSRRKQRVTVQLGQAVLYLARASKSREVDHATWLAANGIEGLEIPDFALDMHTRRGREMGRGWPHFLDEGAQLGHRDRYGHVPEIWRRRAAEKEETE